MLSLRKGVVLAGGGVSCYEQVISRRRKCRVEPRRLDEGRRPAPQMPHGCGEGSSELQVLMTVADSDRTPSLWRTLATRAAYVYYRWGTEAF